MHKEIFGRVVGNIIRNRSTNYSHWPEGEDVMVSSFEFVLNPEKPVTMLHFELDGGYPIGTNVKMTLESAD